MKYKTDENFFKLANDKYDIEGKNPKKTYYTGSYAIITWATAAWLGFAMTGVICVCGYAAARGHVGESAFSLLVAVAFMYIQILVYDIIQMTWYVNRKASLG